MPRIECGPRVWEVPTARPAVALALVDATTITDYVDILLDAMAPEEGALFLAALEAGAVPDDAPVVLVEEWLERSTGLPLTAVGTLSAFAVREWPTVRGRLIRAGIPRPLRDLGTLGALLSAVWDMLLEGAKDEKDAEAMKRKVFRPRARRRSAPAPRRTISEVDRRAQSDMMKRMVGDTE